MRDLGSELLNGLTVTRPAGLRVGRPHHQTPSWASLLESFYLRAGRPLPRLRQIRTDEIPQPYRGLLVHSLDLTPTLETFFRQTLGLTVLSRWRERTCYLREVVLRLAGNGKRVGYGAIRIRLDHLPPAAARRVLEEQAPFGSILHQEEIPHLSWPQAFFRVEPDFHMQHVLEMQRTAVLYGRRNVLLDGSRRLLAEVLETLAPIVETPRPAAPFRSVSSPRGNGAL